MFVKRSFLPVRIQELQRQLNQLENDGLEEKLIEVEHFEAEMVELEDQTVVYIRDFIVTSGLSRKDHDEKVDPKVLLDLLNEALSIVLEPTMTMSRFRKKGLLVILACWYAGLRLGSAPWSGLMNDDVDSFEERWNLRLSRYDRRNSAGYAVIMVGRECSIS
ncbi:hypothetical protein F0562_006787 [Nyssa sinensis]|uniref:Uncharacterized protein n=1 Tax=Nyssa sinensis TaxID=561372 RepID=A0A5J5ASU3_9ASTE|nr:hypothetical protein F0562_006787 [Nyssa sinensis]